MDSIEGNMQELGKVNSVPIGEVELFAHGFRSAIYKKDLNSLNPV